MMMLRRDHQPTIERLFTLMISADDCGAMMLAEESLRSGVTLETFLREVMLPVATIVEKLHQGAQITAEAYEHARRLLLRIAAHTRDLAQQAALAHSSQFVEIRYAQSAVTASVVDHVIDARVAPIIVSEVRGAMKALEGRARSLVLDLSKIANMSAAGLAMCATIESEAHLRGLRLVIYGLDSQSSRLLRLIRGTRTRRAPVAKDPRHLQRLLAA